ncbi:hypothetical protein Patl1_02275 [Pistacia atlantica]|uniref:Uncharacterized protein n=1 Tax=Pistacia atlantica TaxID=434234 RepID=A0ACC1C864_9ROSI|nr:hypothetical protein Patl1_02275 [Pistacia atlantica]
MVNTLYLVGYHNNILPAAQRCYNIQAPQQIINDKKSSLSVYLTGQFLEILKKFRGPEAVVGAPQSICIAIVNYMGEQRVAAVAEKHFIDALHRECIN